MSPTKLAILGAGGPGKDTLGIIDEINKRSENKREFNCIGFLDNDKSKWGKSIHGVEVLGPVEKASDLDSDVQFVNTIGGPSYFWKIPDIISEAGIADERFVSVIHPDAYIAESADLGRGVIVYSDSCIYENAIIGNHVMVKDARISHDDKVSDYTRIEGGTCIAGESTIGEACYLGMNCTIRGATTVEDQALVGMGAVVVDDVPAKTVVAGVPAREMRKSTESDDKYSDI